MDKICSKRTTFDKVIVKIVKNTDLRFTHNTCAHKKVVVIQLPNLQHLFTLFVPLCAQNFLANGPGLT